MAESSSSTSRKRKADDTTMSSRPRKRLSAAELFNPTMVTIRVSESAVIEAGQEAEVEEFIVPRALICSRSKYFESAFGKQWTEGQSRSLNIDDVAPWIFRVFIGWLFYDKLFYDEQRVDPEPLSGGEQHLSSTNRKLSDDLEAGYETRQESSNEASSGNQASTESRVPMDREALPPYILQGDHQDPRTWRYMDLFKLYVFAEKYDTRGLRIPVFDVIQHKLIYMRLIAIPSRSKSLLPPDAVLYLIDNMPEGASITEMLSIVYMDFGANSIRNLRNYFRLLPASFVAMCYLRGLRFHLASNCQTCLKGDTHSRDVGHAPGDGHTMWKRDQCEFHEHGDDNAEMEACKQRWIRRLAYYGPKLIQAGASGATGTVEMCD